jgi:hypothetical protein
MRFVGVNRVNDATGHDQHRKRDQSDRNAGHRLTDDDCGRSLPNEFHDTGNILKGVDAFAPSRAGDILGGFHFTDWLASD